MTLSRMILNEDRSPLVASWLISGFILASLLTACNSGTNGQLETYTVGKRHYVATCQGVPQEFLGKAISPDQLHEITRRVARARTIKGVDPIKAVTIRIEGACQNGVTWFFAPEENLSISEASEITERFDSFADESDQGETPAASSGAYLTGGDDSLGAA